MRKTNLIKLALVLLVSLGLLSAGRAAIIVTAPTDTTSGSLEITSDISFFITTIFMGTPYFVVLDDWVDSDGTVTFTTISPNVLLFLNNDDPVALSGRLYDNSTLTREDITPDDGFFRFAISFNVVAGDTVTLKGGVYSLPAVAGFNPQTTQVFAGNMFVANIDGHQISETVAVPEPSVTTLFIGTGALALASARRRSRNG